jgi:uncharacterized coiled-coil protein SlyX
LSKSDRLLQEGDHEAAMAETSATLRDHYEDLGDRALFQMGTLYAYPGNPDLNYEKSLDSFQRLEKEFPQSPLKNQAAVSISVLHQLLELRENLRTLQAEKAEEDKRLVRLDREVDEKEKVIEKFNKRVAARQAMIDRLKAQISTLQTRLDRVEAQISDLKKVDLRMEERKTGSRSEVRGNREEKQGTGK